ncbi:MAG: quinoprotein glucose dehydrogenase, partial [Parapedobacter sp.]
MVGFRNRWKIGLLLGAAGVVLWINGCMHPVEKEIYDAFYTFQGDTLGVTTVADSLKVPWEIALGPDGDLWYTEQHGAVSRLDVKTGHRKTLLRLEDTFVLRTSGLLGMALHPDMEAHPYVFLAYTSEEGGKQVSRIMRYTYHAEQDTLLDPLVIQEFGAWTSHFGARLLIAPDGKLMVTSGDGAQDGYAQDTSVVLGKVLRFNIDGSVPADNPIAGSPVWAWGFRNPQGLFYASNGILYCSEHGDATDDEVNIVRKGQNYGWPAIEGYVDTEKEQAFAQGRAVTDPLKAWTPTIAPAALVAYEGNQIPAFSKSLLLATLKGSAIRLLKLDESGERIVSDSVLFDQVFGRIRALCVADNGDVYFGTSNRDWNPNGTPQPNDDRILRIRKVGLAEVGDRPVLPAVVHREGVDTANHAAALYTNYCAACHKADGKGVADVFPDLTASALVQGESPDSLVHVVLAGRNEMPAFHFLKDNELAEILKYVRQQFGRGGGVV